LRRKRTEGRMWKDKGQGKEREKDDERKSE
jgi:hypothetical protein